jgi:hypothetical protein
MIQAQPTSLSRRLHHAHPTFREALLYHRRFKHTEVLALVNQRRNNPLYEVTKVGESFEGREINMMKVGNGPHKALLWTQMHGDEPTATMAIFDILNFLEAKGDSFDEVRKQLLANTTLYIVPMLNPDGAERYQRRTAQGIDMNRDALHPQTPEGRILTELQQTLRPDYGFNLHDQSPRYSAGHSSKIATISFLATAYDYERSINPVRERAMKMIVRMNRLLQEFIPGQVARFSDEHEPRAFGDNIQKWGTTLILLESGGYPNDPEKQYIRQLNFVAILSGLAAMADGSVVDENREEYYQIPENSHYLFDFLIKNITISQNGKSYQTDLGINRNEVNCANATKFFYHSVIEEFGDLSTHFGSEEFDADGYTMERGSVYPTPISAPDEAADLNPQLLWKQGYTYLTLESTGYSSEIEFTAQPFHLLRNTQTLTQIPSLDDTATFLIKKSDKIRYVVINGYLYDVESTDQQIRNGIIE